MKKKISLYELKASLNHLQWHEAKYAELGRRNGIQFASMPHCMSIDAFARAGENVCVKIGWINNRGKGLNADIIRYYDMFNSIKSVGGGDEYGDDFIGPSEEMVIAASELISNDEDLTDDVYSEEDTIDNVDDEDILEKDANEESSEDVEEGSLEELVPEESEEDKVLAEAFADNSANNTLVEDKIEVDDINNISHQFFYLIFSFKPGFKLNDASDRSGSLEYTDNEISINALKNSNENREIYGDVLKESGSRIFEDMCKIANNNSFYFYKNLGFSGANETKVEPKYQPLDVDIKGFKTI